jgi:hypothetical protein
MRRTRGLIGAGQSALLAWDNPDGRSSSLGWSVTVIVRP